MLNIKKYIFFNYRVKAIKQYLVTTNKYLNNLYKKFINLI